MQLLESCLVEFVGQIIAKILLGVIFWPVLMILATPFILLSLPFGPGDVEDKLERRYGRAHRLWLRIVEHG